MTYEELKAKYLGVNMEAQGTNHCEQHGVQYVNDIHKVDWVAKGFVQKVKNQGNCGSCWAFAAIGALESAIAISSKKGIPDLSEQELVDCSSSYGNFGCSGGLMGNAFDYILDHHINTQKDYRYKGIDQQCDKKKSGKGKTTLKGCRQVALGVDALTEAIKKQPIAVAFYVQADFFAYAGGVYNPENCDGQPNHGVLAVGFDLDAEIPYYRVKNSWGEVWGDKGFFSIAVGSGNGTCQISGTEWNYYPIA